MRRSPPSSFYVSLLRRQERGAVALLLVIGASLLLLIAGTSLVAQTRQELRIATAETTAVTAEARVQGLMNEAVVMAADPAWPPVEITDCSLSGSYPQACLEAKLRRPVASTYLDMSDPWYNADQIPVRVKWQASESSPVQFSYGWILIDTAGKVSLWYAHQWCTPSADFWSSGPCQEGG